MKRVVIVHCWGGNPDYCWYPQTKKELEQHGFKVEIPAMPETDTPKLALWLPKLKEVISTPDQELFLVGHSSGVITILRYLESLPEGQNIAGAVLVAGFTDDLGYEELQNFFQDPIDFEKIKQHCPEFVSIHSTNDPYMDLKYSQIFKEKLDAKTIIKQNAGHFSSEDNCLVLPVVAQEINRIERN